MQGNNKFNLNGFLRLINTAKHQSVYRADVAFGRVAARKTKPRFGFKIAKIPDVVWRDTRPRVNIARWLHRHMSRRRARETFR